MYKFSIKIPIYGCTVHVIIDNDIEKVINSYVKRKKWDKDIAINDGSEVHGYAVSPPDIKNHYIFYSTGSMTVNYICHEISHIIDNILSQRGVEEKGEARSYLTGFISDKIFDYVLKKQLLINKWLKLENQKNDEKPS